MFFEILISQFYRTLFFPRKAPAGKCTHGKRFFHDSLTTLKDVKYALISSKLVCTMCLHVQSSWVQAFAKQLAHSFTSVNIGPSPTLGKESNFFHTGSGASVPIPRVLARAKALRARLAETHLRWAKLSIRKTWQCQRWGTEAQVAEITLKAVPLQWSRRKGQPTMDRHKVSTNGNSE